MASLVIDLQRDALDRRVATSDLLRKALVVARKLGVSDIENWLTRELNGYPEDAEVPDYRHLQGELKVFNPYRGWESLFIPNPERAERLSKRPTPQSISELEKISSEEGSTGYMKFSKRSEQQIMKGIGFPIEPALIVSQTQVAGIVDKVRNSVLEWALKLEEQGISGEGMSFSREEKEQANTVTFNVRNLIGSIQDSQVQQDTSKSHQTYNKTLDFNTVRALMAELSSRMEQLQLRPETKTELETEIKCINSQLDSPNPKAEVIRECLRSTRSIVEGATGSALFQGIVTAIGAFI